MQNKTEGHKEWAFLKARLLYILIFVCMMIIVNVYIVH